MCIFCQFISGEIPIEPIFENEDVFVFLDKDPVNIGHCQVIPKKHYENIEELPSEIIQQIALVIKEIGARIKNNLGYAGYNLVVNNGVVAGQEVMHSHWHLIPRVEEGEMIWPEHKTYRDGEMEETIKKLKIQN